MVSSNEQSMRFVRTRFPQGKVCPGVLGILPSPWGTRGLGLTPALLLPGVPLPPPGCWLGRPVGGAGRDPCGGEGQIGSSPLGPCSGPDCDRMITAPWGSLSPPPSSHGSTYGSSSLSPPSSGPGMAAAPARCGWSLGFLELPGVHK